MPAYHSKIDDQSYLLTCGCAMCPMKTAIRGPADAAPADVDDIIDETIMYFRANTLFRNFDVRSGSDKTLIYLTLFAQQCLVKCERIEDKSMATKELRALATKQFVIPGESGWPLGGLFAAPADRKESDAFRAYFKQAREELAMRLVNRLFDEAGAKNKWWQSFSKRKFMGKEFRD